MIPSNVSASSPTFRYIFELHYRSTEMIMFCVFSIDLNEKVFICADAKQVQQ